MPDSFFFFFWDFSYDFWILCFGAKTRPKLYDRRELFISRHLVKGGRGRDERGRGRDLRGILSSPTSSHLSHFLLLLIAHSSINSSVDESTDLEAKAQPTSLLWGPSLAICIFWYYYFISKAQQWIPASGSLLGKVSWSISFACLPSPVISDIARLNPPLFVFWRCPSAKLFNLLHPSIATEKPSLILWVARFSPLKAFVVSSVIPLLSEGSYSHPLECIDVLISVG